MFDLVMLIVFILTVIFKTSDEPRRSENLDVFLYQRLGLR